MKLQEVSTEIFSQLIATLEKLRNEEYTLPLGLLFDQSIGKHMRHIIEFYDLALTGYRTGTLNYDHRDRRPELENSRQVAMDKLREMAVLVETFAQDRVLRLDASYSPDASREVTIHSTFYRELLYNIEHAVHHMAIIRIALEATFPHVTVPASFGVAYSTVQYQQK